jgi:LPXTG-motif cell wall-anchored protein
MKEATGEMNMTVITIIAIGAILGLFWFLWPQVKNSIFKTWDDIGGDHNCQPGTYWNAKNQQCE